MKIFGSVVLLVLVGSGLVACKRVKIDTRIETTVAEIDARFTMPPSISPHIKMDGQSPDGTHLSINNHYFVKV
jgi:hypothetical protein